MIKIISILIIISLPFYGSTKSIKKYNKKVIIDKYLKKWLKNDDSVLLFNYKNKKITYTFNKKNFNKKIPIGSIFKIVSTFLILSNHKDIENEIYNCKGKTKKLKCWKKDGHHEVNLKKAFIHSCNLYFYSLENKITLDEWIYYAHYLGFNSYKLSNNMDNFPYFFAGNLVSLKSNIYELAGIISLFATNGNFIDLKHKNNNFTIEQKNIILKIKKLMRKVVTEGTANKVFFKSYGFSGKTGTASDNKGKYNGVFIGFLTDKPYAIVVNINNNIGSNAAKIASDILYLFIK